MREHFTRHAEGVDMTDLTKRVRRRLPVIMAWEARKKINR